MSEHNKIRVSEFVDLLGNVVLRDEFIKVIEEWDGGKDVGNAIYDVDVLAYLLYDAEISLRTKGVIC